MAVAKEDVRVKVEGLRLELLLPGERRWAALRSDSTNVSQAPEVPKTFRHPCALLHPGSIWPMS